MPSHVPNRGPELLGVNIFFMTAAVIANVLRCYVRIRMVKGFGIDDWLMLLATIAFLVYGAFSIAGVHYGTGRHHNDLSLEGIHRARNYWWYCYLFYCVSTISSKLSIGWFLLRIAIKRIHIFIIHSAMFVTVVAGLAFFFVTFFQCNPISYFWNKTQPGTCIDDSVVKALGYLYSTFSIISDLTFALVPAVLVWDLQLKMRTKVALIPLLTMGCIASCAVAVRMPYVKFLSSPDFLWDTLTLAIWSTVEQGLGITAGSLATLRPLFHSFLKNTLSSGPTLPLTRPGGKYPSSSHKLGIRRKQSQILLDETTLTGYGDTENSHNVSVREGSVYQPKSKPKPTVKQKTATDNDSMESLHTQNSHTSTDQDGMHIMVSKSFYITDEQKQ